MKKILLFLITLPVLAACYTTNDVFVPDVSISARPTHELVISSTLPIITLPQNIGFNYRFASPNLGGSGWKLNCFLRYERGLRRVLADADGFDDNFTRIKSDNMKFMVMPGYHFSDDTHLGIGLGLEYVHSIDKNVSTMLLPMLNINLNKIVSSDEDHTNSWSLHLSLCDRFNKRDGVLYESYFSEYDSTTYHYFYDYGSALIWKSLKVSYTHEKTFPSNPGLSAVFRFDLGITVISDLKPASEVIDAQEYPGYRYYTYQGLNFPFGFSVGLKF